MQGVLFCCLLVILYSYNQPSMTSDAALTDQANEKKNKYKFQQQTFLVKFSFAEIVWCNF
jgi:hypothetical protein